MSAPYAVIDFSTRVISYHQRQEAWGEISSANSVARLPAFCAPLPMPTQRSCTTMNAISSGWNWRSAR